MRIRELLNIILLSVSLSTVLISIVSYILFKVKQKNNSLDDENPLEGVFFRKYAPHILKRIEEEKRIREAKGNQPKGIKIKFTVAFGVLFLIVISGMFLENYFQFRKSVKNRITTAEKIRSLIDEGLLQVHEYNPVENRKKIVRAMPRSLRGYFENNIAQLKSHKFCFYSNKQSQLHSSKHVDKLNLWQNSFEKNNLNYIVTDQINNNSCIYIFAHVNSLRESQRNELKSLLNNSNKHKVIIVGELGNLNGVGKPSNDKIEIPNLALINKESTVRHYKKSSNYNGLTPFSPGEAFTVAAKDLSLEFYSQKSSPYFDTDYKSTFYSKDQDVLYLGLDFKNTESYQDMFLTTLIFDIMVKFLEKEQASIAFWPSDYQGALSLSLELTENIELNNRFEETLKDYNIPYALIMPFDFVGHYSSNENKEFREVIGTFRNNQGYFNMNTFELFNLASHLRLEIEEKTTIKVSGFTLPNRVINLNLFNATFQNKLNYFLGVESYLTSYPVKLDNQFYYLNSMSYSDIQINKKLLLKEKPLNYLYEQKVLDEGGMFNFTLRPNQTSYIDQEILLKDLLKGLNSEKTWVSTPAEIATWQRLREGISLTWVISDTEKRLVIKNYNQKDIGAFNISCFSKRGPLLMDENVKKISDNQYQFKVPSLKANEETVIEFK